MWPCLPACLPARSRQADERGQLFYLEASSEASRRLYLRHGFRDYKQASMGLPCKGVYDGACSGCLFLGEAARCLEGRAVAMRQV